MKSCVQVAKYNSDMDSYSLNPLFNYPIEANRKLVNESVATNNSIPNLRECKTKSALDNISILQRRDASFKGLASLNNGNCWERLQATI